MLESLNKQKEAGADRNAAKEQLEKAKVAQDLQIEALKQNDQAFGNWNQAFENIKEDTMKGLTTTEA